MRGAIIVWVPGRPPIDHIGELFESVLQEQIAAAVVLAAHAPPRRAAWACEDEVDLPPVTISRAIVPLEIER